MIEINKLTKKFNSDIVLDKLSFSVKRGEILGFLGPNGAGKTTTMKIITGFWSPSKGEVKIDGVNTEKDSIRAKKKIGYLPENVPLYEDMLVKEYLKFIAEIRYVKNKKERIKEVVNLCGLSKVYKKPIDELSKGYRQRVGLAQAIMHNPDVLILDEPTTGLDPNQIVEIRDLIKKIGKEKTVIFSTHILGEVSSTCDRVIIINKGKIVGEGRPDELLKKSKAKNSIYIKIKGSRDEVYKQLKRLKYSEYVKIKDKESDNLYGYEVNVKENKDIREELSKMIFRSGWNIFEMQSKRQSLEDVFRELTK
jgi:ABC-2 type transport system ATP-binding protein